MKQLTIKLLTLIGVMAFVPSAFGCFCITPELPDAFKQAKAVFVGEVVEIVPPQSSADDAPLQTRLYQIKFKVQRAWKGTLPSLVYTVLSGNGEQSCLAFQRVAKGETYLIYADPAYGAEKWSLIKGCGGRSMQLNYGRIARFDPQYTSPFEDIRQLNLLTGQVPRPRFGGPPPINYRRAWSSSFRSRLAH